MNYSQHTQCRVCGSKDLKQYLDLGNLPLTNNLCDTIYEAAPRYPLQVNVCTECWLSQLSIVVDPELLFGNYVYRSSISQSFLKHCNQMAIDLRAEYGFHSEHFHVDIAGNDGALLAEFKKELNHSILNIDPAKNMAAICQAKSIPTLTYFWSAETARRVLNGFGQADLITATNVIAHLDNLHDFFEGIKIALKPTGVFIIECPYLIPFIENNEFATLYQEHVSVMSVNPLKILCEKFGLTLMKVEEQDIHCGSIRLHIGHGQQHESVQEFLDKEKKYHSIEPYKKFATVSKETIEDFRSKLNDLYNKGKKVWGFGASAKGNTLLNSAGITCGMMQAIVDHTPEKIGRFSPGTHIPIVSELELKSNPPDYLVILSWNFVFEIIEKCKNAGYTGKFILPIPHFQILDNE